MTQIKFDTYMIAALVLALFSFALSGVISDKVFERLPHLEDEVAYLFQAEVFASGNMVIAPPVPARPFWKPFVIDHSSGTRFSKYTPGWSLMLALGITVGQYWVVNAFCAMLTVLFTFRLGRDLFDRDVGLIAAALLAFSPIALLLSGTLMSHTSALMFATLFMYAYWYMSKHTPQAVKTDPPAENSDGEQVIATPNGNSALRWAIVAGIALGLLVINRPLTGIAVAVPFILWSLIRLGRVFPLFMPTLRPLVALAGAAIGVSLLIPLYNAAATGDPTQNLYLLVWDYDKVGFGEDYGRNGHTIEKGVRFAQFDLSLLGADLFGWQLGTFDTELQQYVIGDAPEGVTADAFWLRFGLSWIFILPGLIIGFKNRWAWLWAANILIWLFWLHSGISNDVMTWLLVGLVLWAAPLMFVLEDRDERPMWVWLLLSVAVCLVTVHLGYWINAQRYSTRYYFEGISALCLISAIPLAWLIRKLPNMRLLVYAGLVIACLWSFVAYSTPRIDALRGYNRVSMDLIHEVNARRQTDKPVLVILEGDVTSWRAYGALMAATTPFLDSDIVAAWDSGIEGLREQIVEKFPDREIIEMGVTNNVGGDHSWFLDECPSDGGECPVANPPREWN